MIHNFSQLCLPSESLNDKWRNYHILFRFPTIESEPVNVKCAQRKRKTWWGGCEGESIPGFSLGESWEGRRAAQESVRALAQEGAYPGNKGRKVEALD